MAAAEELILKDVQRMGLQISAQSLQVPVYATDGHGRDLRETCVGQDIMKTLISMQCSRTVQWAAAVGPVTSLSQQITHVLDFGPGGLRGAATLTKRVIAEHGHLVPIILSSPQYMTAVDTDGCVYGMEALLADQGEAATSPSGGAKKAGLTSTVSAMMAAQHMRKVVSTPVFSHNEIKTLQAKVKNQKRLTEIDATRVSISDFQKRSARGNKQSLFKHKQVTFVTD